MYLSVCEHPLRIKTDGRFQYVPCGKCPTCLNRRSSRIVERLEQESQCHAYVLFFTLSYDERHCPKMYYDYEFNRLFDPDRENYVDLSEIKDFKPSSRLYLARRKEIPYADFEDIKKFFKRLRYYIGCVLHATREEKKIRYYVVSEYGPSTYRPHYHGLLWFDSFILARCIYELISKSWAFGRIDTQFVTGKAESYVARYVSCTASLPKVYLHKFLRPKSVCSQSPSVGTLEINSKEVREIFDGCLVERVLHSQRSHKSKISPLWRTFEDRLFPRITGFDKFSHCQRVTLYSVYSIAPVEGFKNFVDWIFELSRKDYRTWLSDYLISLLDIELNEHKYVEHFYRLRKLYYISSRVYHQRRIFGVSLDFYVSKIDEYWSKKKMFSLKNFYGFQENFVRLHQDTRPLIYMYPESEDIWNIPYWRLSQFGFDTSTHLSLSASIDAAKELLRLNYSEFVGLNHKIFFDNRKTKKRNDYIESINDTDKFNFNLLKDYE